MAVEGLGLKLSGQLWCCLT